MTIQQKGCVLLSATLAVMAAFVIAVGVGDYPTIGDAPALFKLTAIAALTVIYALSHVWARD